MIVHTVPVNDLIEHATDGTACPCQPDQVVYDNGAKQIIHNSADGREHSEPDHDASACKVCNPYYELHQAVAQLKAALLPYFERATLWLADHPQALVGYVMLVLLLMIAS